MVSKSINTIEICKRCIIPNGYKGKKLDANQNCSYCNEDSYTGIKRSVKPEKKSELAQKLNEKLRNVRGKFYDVAVGFSGGKDSSYLIYKLKKEFNLNVLAIIIDHSYFPEVVESNIKKVTNRLNVDMIYHRVSQEFMNRYFLYKMKTFRNTSKSIFDVMCGDCSDIIEGTVMKIAAQLEIPIALIGLSPEQTNRYFYKIPQKHIEENWIRDFYTDSEFFLESDKKYLWNPTRDSEKNLEVYIPFHVWDYNVEGIKRTLEDENILLEEESEPLKTECEILQTIRFIDKTNLGYDPRVGPFSDLIRFGNASRDEMIQKFYLEDMDESVVDTTLGRLNLRREDLIIQN